MVYIIQKDAAFKILFQDGLVFAEAVNLLLEPLAVSLSTEGLVACNPETVGCGMVDGGTPGNRGMRRITDIAYEGDILYFGDRIRHVMYMEHQSEPSYSMPVRNIQTAAGVLSRQYNQLVQAHRERGDLKTSGEFLCGMTADDRLVPYLVFVLYTGAHPWDGPRLLRDMFRIGRPDYMAAMACHYDEAPCNLISLADVPLERVGRLKSLLRPLVRLIQARGDLEKIEQVVLDDPYFQCISPANLQSLEALADVRLHHGKGKENRNMLDLIDYIKKRERKQALMLGKREGVLIGEENCILKFIKGMRDRHTDSESLREQLKDFFSLDDSQINDLLSRI